MSQRELTTVQYSGDLKSDTSRFWMVKYRSVCQRSTFQMGSGVCRDPRSVFKFNLTIVFLSKNSRSILTLKSWSPTIWKPTKWLPSCILHLKTIFKKPYLEGLVFRSPWHLKKWLRLVEIDITFWWLNQKIEIINLLNMFALPLFWF